MSAPRSRRRPVDGEAIRREVEARIERAGEMTLPAELIAPNPAPLPPVDPVLERPLEGTPSEPVGVAAGARLGSYGNPSIDQHDALFLAASDAVERKKGVRVNPRVLKAMMGLESGEDGNYPVSRCRAYDGYPGPKSCGPMQIKWPYHAHRCRECSQTSLADNVEMAAHIIGDTMKEHRCDEYEAYIRGYLTSDDINGTSQQDAVRGLKRRVAQMEANAGPITPPPDPVPGPDVDPYRIICGGDPPVVTYGFKAPAAGPFYDYFAGHGGNANQHTGDDLPLPYGATVYAPIAGTVVCSATGTGPGAWNTGCAAFRDTGNAGPDGPDRGVGRVEILAEDGRHSVIFGHSRQSLVAVGAKVKPGDPLCTVGGMLGSHIHLEVRVQHPTATYHIIDPKPALRSIMGQTPPPPTRAGYVHYTNVPGASNGLWLPEGLRFRVHLINPAQTNQRPGTRMTPTRYVQHETGNPNPGADAAMHLRYLLDGAPDKYGRPQQLGYHLTVDKDEVVLMLPLNEIAWHGGDGAGPCNMGGIACELCVEDNNANKVQARANAEAVAAAVMESLGLAQIDPHQACSGKDCPHYMLADGYWPEFEANVAAARARIRGGSGGGSVPPPGATFPGLSIPIQVFEALFLDPSLPADPDGPFSKWMAANDWHYPVHRLVRDGNESYLITGNGILHYHDGAVEVLDDDAAAALASRTDA